MRRRRISVGGHGHGDEDVPWASFADALTGLLFVFILLALSFAYQLQQATAKAEDELERQLGQAKRAQKIASDLVNTDPEADRKKYSVAKCLEEKFSGSESFRLRPTATEEEARLSLYLDGTSETISTVRWFESGKARLPGHPCEVARAIGPCIEDALQHPDLENKDDNFLLRVFVEGHTDVEPVKNGVFVTNWELSGARAAAVVRAFLVPPGNQRSQSDCSANHDVSRLESSIAEGRLDVVAVGLAERRPAWKRLCEVSPDGVCDCLKQGAGRTQDCAADLKKDAEGSEYDLPATVADQLIAWANRDDKADPDARRRLQRRVDLRFEVTPRHLDVRGGGSE